MDAVQHFELPYKVRDRAKKFYFQAFGWQLFDVPGTGYSFATTVPIEPSGMPKRPGAINGGLLPRSKELSGPTLLVKVGDLAAHLERIRHAGGSVVTPPTPMGPVWYARFRDTEGNVMGAIQDRPDGMEAAKKVVQPKKAAAGKGKAKTGAKPASRKAKVPKARAQPAKSKRPAKRSARRAGKR